MVGRIAIDGTGRLVIPRAIRAQLHLRAGSQLEVRVEGEQIVLAPVEDHEALAEEHGLLVATGVPAGPLLDHRQVRDARTAELADLGVAGAKRRK